MKLHLTEYQRRVRYRPHLVNTVGLDTIRFIMVPLIQMPCDILVVSGRISEDGTIDGQVVNALTIVKMFGLPIKRLSQDNSHNKQYLGFAALAFVILKIHRTFNQSAIELFMMAALWIKSLGMNIEMNRSLLFNPMIEEILFYEN